MKRIISLMLCLCLLLAVLPVGALAADKPVYLALGDGIVSGSGLEDPALCFAGILAQSLGYELTNLGVEGSTAADLRAQVLSGEIDEQIASADLITVTCGVNDMLHLLYDKVVERYNASNDPDITTADVDQILYNSQDTRFMALAMAALSVVNGNADAGIAPFVQSEAYLDAVSAYAGCLDEIKYGISQLNPDAEVVITTLYNPYKQFTGLFADLAAQLDTGIQILNSPITHPDSGHTYADLYAAFNQHTEVLTNATSNPLNLDFHPNAGGHEVIAATLLEVVKSLNPFEDVKKGAFYYEPVMWAVENGITNGVDATHFGTNADCNRAQVVTFLWRACGSPEPESTDCSFTDVKEGDFYYKPVLWAVENGITNGISATEFGANNNCSRAQVVTFLWRAVNKPEPESTGCSFTDVKAGDFYYKPVLWAVENGITNGISPTVFGTNTDCSRAQVVTFLYRTNT